MSIELTSIIQTHYTPMKNHYLLLIIVLFPLLVKAHKPKKPTLIVYGHDIEAFSAAIQSAKSGVPTLWVVDSEKLVPAVTEVRTAIRMNDNLDAGIWRTLLLASHPAMTPSDSTVKSIRVDMNPQLMKNAVDRLMAQEPNLSVQKGQKIIGLKNGGNRWQVTLANKQKYEVAVLLDFSNTEELSQLIGFKPSATTEVKPIEQYTTAEQRLWMASGIGPNRVMAFSMDTFLSGYKDNYFNVRHLIISLGNETEYVPLRSNIGQALGAIGGYCAFFKTSADKIDVRKAQDELLQYGAKLIPYQDIPVDDPFALGIQKFGLTSLWQEPLSDGQYLFHKDNRISFENVKPVFNQLYSRSQIWFLDNTGDYLKWKDALSLIKYVSQRGDELDKQIEQEWVKKLRFEGTFELEHYISKYQFAVIVDRYCNPFVVRVNAEGKIVR